MSTWLWYGTAEVNVQAQLIFPNWLRAMLSLASQFMSPWEVFMRHSCEYVHPRACCITKHLSRCDYSHTLILRICALFFAFKVFNFTQNRLSKRDVEFVKRGRQNLTS